MRAVRLTGFGGLDRLEYREDVPEPQPGPGEVRVRVGATGINNTDIWTREGAYGRNGESAQSGWHPGGFAFPRIQGADIVGRIDAVGQGVPSARIGERVVVDPVLYVGDETGLARAGYLGSERDGGFAELVTVPAGNALRLDSGLSDAEVATFPTAYATAFRMLRRAGLESGDCLLVTGAGGGVGSALVQIGVLRGATVIGVTSAAKRDWVLGLGATATVDRQRGELPEQIRSTGCPRPAVIADVVGGALFPALLEVLAPFGRYVVAGAIDGPLVEADLRTVYLEQLQLIGSSMATHEEFAAVVDLIQANALKPLLAGTYPLAELRQAQQDFLAKAFVGKLVVTVAPPGS
jgi:NADPH:quinone reductase-like Zn-dependent oxidoreductase